MEKKKSPIFLEKAILKGMSAKAGISQVILRGVMEEGGRRETAFQAEGEVCAEAPQAEEHVCSGDPPGS